MSDEKIVQFAIHNIENLDKISEIADNMKKLLTKVKKTPDIKTFSSIVDEFDKARGELYKLCIGSNMELARGLIQDHIAQVNGPIFRELVALLKSTFPSYEIAENKHSLDISGLHYSVTVWATVVRPKTGFFFKPTANKFLIAGFTLDHYGYSVSHDAHTEESKKVVEIIQGFAAKHNLSPSTLKSD